MRPVNPLEFIGSRAGNPNGGCNGFAGMIKNDVRRAKRLVGFCATHLPVQAPIRNLARILRMSLIASFLKKVLQNNFGKISIPVLNSCAKSQNIGNPFLISNQN